MKIPKPRVVLESVKKLFATDPDRFLRSTKGVIHVGANTGQEREAYAALGLRVLWVEPVPWVFDELKANISQLPLQQAIQALVTDRDGQEYDFHIANNEAASSSILELKDHRDIWPEVEYTQSISLKSKTLPSVLADNDVEPASFDALIMDTQGSELLILQGAEALLQNFRYIKTEVADFEAYAGCCQLDELDQFMSKHGFRTLTRRAFAHRDAGGTYYDVTYQQA